MMLLRFQLLDLDTEDCKLAVKCISGKQYQATSSGKQQASHPNACKGCTGGMAPVS